MKEKILKLLDGLVSCRGISCSESENITSEYVYDYLKNLNYFKNHPELVGRMYIPGDRFGRFIPYGLVLGNSRKTVIFGGHTDVVTASVYGDIEDYAFNINEIEDHIKDKSLSEEARRDLESGEWIWGRGAADMKSGVAVNLVLLEEYSKLADSGCLEGSILFMAVPDEESYSAGMRNASGIMKDFKDRYGLEYKLLINPEPAAVRDGKQIMSLGTVGKILPVILTQGKLAHIGHYFSGISGLNMLNNIYEKTNGSMKFADVYKGEVTVPPVWASLRDLKEVYDVSLPERGYGYMTVLSFNRRPDEIIDELKCMACEAFDEEIEKLNIAYDEMNRLKGITEYESIKYDRLVYTAEEFCNMLHEKYGGVFDDFYRRLYECAGDMLHKGEDYPAVTVYMLNRLLDFSGIKNPVILIGISPPYYPSAHSDMVKGREGFGSEVYRYAKRVSEEKFNQELGFEHYFMGISDNSYTSQPVTDTDSLSRNYPMWGSLYSIDFESMSEVAVPSILYGPVSKEYHQWTERVNKKSLLEVMPYMMKEIIQFAWEN